MLYDALFLSSDEVMGKQTGRKALVILTDGVDHGSKESLASAIEAAQRADAIVYAIYFKGRGAGGCRITAPGPAPAAAIHGRTRRRLPRRLSR